MIHPKDDKTKAHAQSPSGEASGSQAAHAQDQLNLDDEQVSVGAEIQRQNDGKIDQSLPEPKLYNI